MRALLSRYRDLYQLAKLAHEPLLWSLGASFNVKCCASLSYDIIDSQWNGRDVAVADITWWTSPGPLCELRTASNERAGPGNKASTRVHRFIKTRLVSEKFHVLIMYLLDQWKLGTFNYAPLYHTILCSPTNLGIPQLASYPGPFEIFQMGLSTRLFTSIQYSNPHSATFVCVCITCMLK